MAHMIPRTVDKRHESSTIITNSRTLRDMIQLQQLDPPQSLFPLRVPLNYLQQMVTGDMKDPLLLQVWPQGCEEQKIDGYSDDPVGDLAATTHIPGVIHKYRGRVLLMVTSNCAIHCRFCFRRNYPYDAGVLQPDQWMEAHHYIANDSSINEVILSGGDPLMLDPARLTRLSGMLAHIPHLKRLRIHSRVPIVDPQRLTPAYYQWLEQIPQQVIMVVHCNHANELSPATVDTLRHLRASGVHLLNQSVLLKGVNDQLEVLTSLSERLFEHGVLPYYLHLLDRATGTAHFHVEDRVVNELMDGLYRSLPGYLVPKMVREQIGLASKSPIHYTQPLSQC